MSAQLPGNFNPSQHEEMKSFDPMPAGWYHLKIVESEIKLTKKAKENDDPSIGTGLNLQMEVIHGKYKGRKIFQWINYIHQDPDTQKRGTEELATICKVLGYNNGLPDNNTGHLHNKPFDAKLRITKAQPGYESGNSCSMYKKYGESDAGAATVDSSSGGNQSAVKVDDVDKVESKPEDNSGKVGSNW